MKYIVKKSVVEIPASKGSISDTTNISDKTTNTYSANVIEKLLAGTTLYEGTSFASSGTLKESITNYKRVKVYVSSGDAHSLVQEVLTEKVNTGGSVITSFWSGSVLTTADGTYYGKITRLVLKDNTFTLNRNYSINLKNSPSIIIAEENSYIVKKIVGYKY